jgi:hypothetical protein
MDTSALKTKSSREAWWRARITANSVSLLFFAANALCVAYAAPAQQKAQLASPPPAKDTKPTEDADKGKRLYAKYGCYECHGYQGQGSNSAGPRIAPRPIPFDAFLVYVRQPSGEMPPYTERVISGSELADIRAFLATIKKGPEPSQVPLLK